MNQIQANIRVLSDDEIVRIHIWILVFTTNPRYNFQAFFFGWIIIYNCIFVHIKRCC